MIRAYVTDDRYGLGVSLAIVLRSGDDERSPATEIMRLNDGTPRWESLEPMVVTEPTLRIDDDSARALLDALTRYYHGAEDTRALRKDYDGERARVDKLTATLGDVVKALVSEP